MQEEDAPARVHAIGEQMQAHWLRLAEEAGLTLTMGELPALSTYTVDGRDPLLVKTFLTTRLLDAGILGGPVFYASIAHTPELTERYLDALIPIYAELASLDDTGLAAALPNGPAQSGFARLT
jgi:glutamate-1-semialdehyde 2,1-aminomutase